jgi:hypothetical protein
VRKKASKSVAAISSIAASTWGIGLKELRQLYTGVVIPQLTYGCSLWFLPIGDPNHKQWVENALSVVQNEALRAVSGAFKATSASALQIETYIAPIRQSMAKVVDASALRIMKSPVYADILRIRREPETKQDRRKIQCEPPLECLAEWMQKRLGKVELTRLETVRPVLTPPCWKDPVIYIDTGKEAAQDNHNIVARDVSILRIYTDGS